MVITQVSDGVCRRRDDRAAGFGDVVGLDSGARQRPEGNFQNCDLGLAESTSGSNLGPTVCGLKLGQGEKRKSRRGSMGMRNVGHYVTFTK